jgi:hypothetical protein
MMPVGNKGLDLPIYALAIALSKSNLGPEARALRKASAGKEFAREISYFRRMGRAHRAEIRIRMLSTGRPFFNSRSAKIRLCPPIEKERCLMILRATPLLSGQRLNFLEESFHSLSHSPREDREERSPPPVKALKPGLA